MRDIFLDFDIAYNTYKDKKDLYDKISLYQLDILNGAYQNILGLKPGSDLLCFDNMEFSEYIKMISKEFVSIVKNFREYLKSLERDLIVPSFDYRAICSQVSVCGMISCNFLLDLFKELGIEYKEVHFHNGIHDEDGVTISILDNGEYKRYSFFGSNYIIRMLEVKDDEIVFDSKLEYLLGTDFIRFLVNYEYNTGSCDIKAICSAYKKSCLNR